MRWEAVYCRQQNNVIDTGLVSLHSVLEGDAWSEMRDGNLISVDQSEFDVLATGKFVAVIRVLVILRPQRSQVRILRNNKRWPLREYINPRGIPLAVSVSDPQPDFRVGWP
jgi:hypothetical protein